MRPGGLAYLFEFALVFSTAAAVPMSLQNRCRVTSSNGRRRHIEIKVTGILCGSGFAA